METLGHGDKVADVGPKGSRRPLYFQPELPQLPCPVRWERAAFLSWWHRQGLVLLQCLSGHGRLCLLKTVSPELWARTNSPSLCGFLAHLVATVRKVTNKHPHLTSTFSKPLHGCLNPRTLLSPVHVLRSDHRSRG